jgi:hypothetical protein
MIGTVLSFDKQKATSYYPGKYEYEYIGVISVNGGERFRFKMGQWKESEHPAVGDIVDFAPQSYGKEATAIFWEAEYGKAVKRLYLAAEYLTEGHLAASIAAESIAAPDHHRTALQRAKKKSDRASSGRVFDFIMITIAIFIVLFFYYVSQVQNKRYRASLDPGYPIMGSPPSPPPRAIPPPSPRTAAGRPGAAA